MMNEYSEFKPVDRSRAYTWHGSHSGIDDSSDTANKFAVTVQTYNVDASSSSTGQLAKKPWSRRNAWGSMSYADLIGKAIESTADKRMTLSQIYEWMIQNVPYFHDKGTGNSSTGWKNSIRHNLSLHRRFKRVPNEDSGKSSWWMLNDAAEQYHPPRKRTVSVGKYEGKDLLVDPLPPSAKMSRLAAEPLTAVKLQAASASTSAVPSQSHTVQPIAGYGIGVLQVPEVNQLNWHQLSTAADPFFAVDLNPTFVSPSYMPTSCTPLAPISELLSPHQFSSYDLQAVEIPSPPSYVNIQTVSGEQSSFSGHNPGNNLTALSSVKLLESSLPSSLEMYTEGGQAPSEHPVVMDSAERLQAAGSQWTPGWSMLRQMLSQSHRENALMHGVITDNPASSTADETCLLEPGTTTALPVSSFSALPMSVDKSNVVYVQVSADTDDTQQCVQLTTDETGNCQQQPLVSTDYSEVFTSADMNAAKNDNSESVDDSSV